MVIDHLAIKLNLPEFKEDFFGAYIKTNINGETYILYKPYTYMNNSGQGVRAIVDFYKIEIDDIIVIHDDLDLPTGSVRIRKSCSSGGHNGIKSIISHLGTESFKRLRIGIAKPEHATVVDYVLGKFDKDEQVLVRGAIVSSADAIIDWSKDTFDVVMSKFNKKNEQNT